MSFELPKERKSTLYRSRWSGAAFIVEAMLLLAFVAASLAVVTQLFAASAEHATQSRYLTDAVAVASATAERFSADPKSIDSEFERDDLRVLCDITSEETKGGTLWHAAISVYPKDVDSLNWAAPVADVQATSNDPAQASDGPTPLYVLTTSVYESEV